MAVQKTVLALCIIFYTINQASSLKCYVCASTSDGDCYKDPKKAVYEKYCVPSRSIGTNLKLPDLTNSTSLSTLESISAIGGSGVSDTASPYASDIADCCKIRGTIVGRESVLRLCVGKLNADQEIKDAATMAGMTVNTLSRCDIDLCNSSSSLSIGFFSLICSLLLMFSARL